MAKVALVLSGGGSRGAYQVGVWKALRKLHIKFDIVTGTSIGALNGIFIVQNEYHKCCKLWKKIDFTYLDNTINKKNAYLKYAQGFITHGGLDTSKLEILLKKYYNSTKFYSSKRDYGVVVYNLSKLKPEFIKKSEVSPIELLDYVIASASCFPALKMKEIDGQKYIDGGYHDVLPINLAVSLGAKKIIAVDLKAVGIRSKLKDKTIEIKNIEPRNKISSFLIFDKKEISAMLKFGYNDTMKEYNRLDGNLFTFKRNHLTKNLKKYKKPIINLLKELFGADKNIFNNIIKTKIYNEILQDKNFEQNINETIEYLGQTFDLEEDKIYSIKNYNQLLINKMEAIKFKTKSKDKSLLSLLSNKTIIKHIYDNIIEKREIETLVLFPKDFMAAVYLAVVKEDLWKRKIY